MKKSILIVLAAALISSLSAQPVKNVNFHDSQHQEWFKIKPAGNEMAGSFKTAMNGLFSNGRTLREKAVAGEKQALDSVLSLIFDQDSQKWMPDDMEFFVYDSRENQIRWDYKMWDAEKEVWALSEQEVLLFDERDRMILQTGYYFDEESGKMVELYKSETDFDGDLISEMRFFNWDPESGEWITGLVTTYEYDGNLLKSTINGGADVNADGVIDYLDRSRTAYHYNEQGDVILVMQYSCDQDNVTWIETGKTEYTYTSNPDAVSMVTYSWNDEGGQWVRLYRTLSSFTPSGDPAENLMSFWDSQTSTWLDAYKEVYEYDPDGNISSIVWYGFDYETLQLTVYDKFVYTYNNDFSWDDLVLPYGYPEGVFKHMVTGTAYYEYIDGTWVELERSTAYYSKFNASGIRSELIPRFRVFPNPASEWIYIDGISPADSGMVRFQLYDRSGRKVSDQLLSGNSWISVDALPAGVYLCRIVSGKVGQSGVIIKK